MVTKIKQIDYLEDTIISQIKDIDPYFALLQAAIYCSRYLSLFLKYSFLAAPHSQFTTYHSLLPHHTILALRLVQVSHRVTKRDNLHLDELRRAPTIWISFTAELPRNTVYYPYQNDRHENESQT